MGLINGSVYRLRCRHLVILYNMFVMIAEVVLVPCGAKGIGCEVVELE